MSASLQELWAPWFAWHPVRTLDGRFLWLRRVRRRWIPMVPGIRTASSR